MSKISKDKKRKKQEQLERLGLLPTAYCESCRNQFPRSKLYFGPDPFAQEIYNENIETILCDECYRQSCLDI